MEKILKGPIDLHLQNPSYYLPVKSVKLLFFRYPISTHNDSNANFLMIKNLRSCQLLQNIEKTDLLQSLLQTKTLFSECCKILKFHKCQSKMNQHVSFTLLMNIESTVLPKA